MATEGNNTERLISAGVIPTAPPEPYVRVIEALKEDEVDALITAVDALKRAGDSEGVPADFGMVVPL